MDATSASLLERLRSPTPRVDDWDRLHAIYEPFIRRVLRKSPELATDADDLVQEVLLVLVRKVRDFNRKSDGSFRAWLREITRLLILAWLREKARQPSAADTFLDQLADPQSEESRAMDAEHDRHLFAALFAAVQQKVEPNTWRAFELMSLHGKTAKEAAAELGMTEAAVFTANSRVKNRLREEAGEMID